MKHIDQVIALLNRQISNSAEVKDIVKTAREVTKRWIDPRRGGVRAINGLVYGLVQSGKTGILTATAAMSGDQGYRTIIILTSDNDALYLQTLNRVHEALPGVDILGKKDFRYSQELLNRVKGGPCAIVATKNKSILGTLIENFNRGRVEGQSCLIIDDEADQASLDTNARKARKANDDPSPINDKILKLRKFFDRNTYLQVTGTPMALFLQGPNHAFRPKFTVLSHPGAEYVGGDDFFGEGSELVREFDMDDITMMAPGPQHKPSTAIPTSLLHALDTFMVGATYKRLREPGQNFAFLCHVSTRNADHDHIVDLLRRYKIDLASGLKARHTSVITRINKAYRDLSNTHADLARFDFRNLLQAIQFFSAGLSVKLVNGQTDDYVELTSPYNLFVGGNKLGRGVTIKNLLVSYYGRNPKKPHADTVLQHARMYGYRRKDIGLLRLFLPHELHVVFRAIHNMERGLRELIARKPSEGFRGIYLEDGIHATRQNVLAKGSIGMYAGGSNYNPAQILRDASVESSTKRINEILGKVKNKGYQEFPIVEMERLLALTSPDPRFSEKIWNQEAIRGALLQFAKLYRHKIGYVYVDRGRTLRGNRRERKGILTGGERGTVPEGLITLFMLRTRGGRNQTEAWWPQIRFPDGQYAFAFAL